MLLIVGLGNPGKRFDLTRHNAGFLVLDCLADKLGVKLGKIKFQSLIAETQIDGQKVVLMKPQTFMNLSGEAVRAAAEYYKSESANIIIIYDDIDIDFGTIRLRPKGSAGTHNGMRNIVYQLESDRFPRVRVGIRGNQRDAELHEYVLSRFAKEEEKMLADVVNRAADAALAIVREGIDAAMNRYNTAPSLPQISPRISPQKTETSSTAPSSAMSNNIVSSTENDL